MDTRWTIARVRAYMSRPRVFFFFSALHINHHEYISRCPTCNNNRLARRKCRGGQRGRSWRRRESGTSFGGAVQGSWSRGGGRSRKVQQKVQQQLTQTKLPPSQSQNVLSISGRFSLSVGACRTCAWPSHYQRRVGFFMSCVRNR